MIFWVIRRKKLFYYYRSDPDPFFHETDPRIRISIKMKRIRNTVIKSTWMNLTIIRLIILAITIGQFIILAGDWSV